MLELARITKATIGVLDALLEADGDAVWGLRVIDVSGLAAGTVYPILARLEAEKWVTSHWDDDAQRRGPRRRLYELTDEGFTAAVLASKAFHRSSLASARPAWGMS